MRWLVFVGTGIALGFVTLSPPQVLVQRIEVSGEGFETPEHPGSTTVRTHSSEENQVVVHLGHRRLKSTSVSPDGADTSKKEGFKPEFKGPWIHRDKQDKHPAHLKTDVSRLLAEYALILAITAVVLQLVPRPVEIGQKKRLDVLTNRVVQSEEDRDVENLGGRLLLKRFDGLVAQVDSLRTRIDNFLLDSHGSAENSRPLEQRPGSNPPRPLDPSTEH